MKTLLKTTALTLLLTTSLSANSATYWTPAVIKASLNNASLVKITSGYISGLNQTFKAQQNIGLIDKYLCAPDNVTVRELRNIVLNTSTRGFAKTSDGGIHFIFTAIYNKYPCK